MAARPPASLPDVAENLSRAIVRSSTIPLLLLDQDFRVLAASETFRQAFNIGPSLPPEPEIFSLGDGEWNVPQLRSLLRATLSGDADIEAYQMDLRSGETGTRNLVLNARRLGGDPSESSRILLTITDMTTAWADLARRTAEMEAKDALLKHQAMLLQEVRHRVANSLQIIASVLLQSARRVNSDETRAHLRDAHQRVMSVATLQHQLAATSLEDVTLSDYFTNLCDSIASSMIGDPDRIVLRLDVDGTVVPSEVSISLGLIVTELVINALKHAFPRGHPGEILVRYTASDGDWSLQVSDNGMGMPAAPKATAGLGTSIVEALARQLGAVASVENNHPGTIAAVTHTAREHAKLPEATAL